jgi:hypothetical protein
MTVTQFRISQELGVLHIPNSTVLSGRYHGFLTSVPNAVEADGDEFTSAGAAARERT